MGEDIDKYRFYVFIRFCRMVGFLLREGVVFCVLSCLMCFLGAICISPMYFGVSSFGNKNLIEKLIPIQTLSQKSLVRLSHCVMCTAIGEIVDYLFMVEMVSIVTCLG